MVSINVLARSVSFTVAFLSLAPLMSDAGAAPADKLAFVSLEGRALTPVIYVQNIDGTGRTRLGEGTTPAWSPDGSKIAFGRVTIEPSGASNPDIWVMDADGSNRRRLTDDPANDLQPAWSPDGRRIAFASSRVRTPDIFVMGADGNNETRLTTDTSGDTEPSWSPDGSRIAFVSTRLGGTNIFSMRSDGTDQTNLTASDADTSPAWAPTV